MGSPLNTWTTMPPMRQLHAPDEATHAHVVAALAAALASNPRVAFAYLYGSFAEGRAFRDIDVGVYLAGDVTRDVDEAIKRADRIAILEHGRIQQVGTPLQIYDQPQSIDVAQRLGSPTINVLPGMAQSASKSASVFVARVGVSAPPTPWPSYLRWRARKGSILSRDARCSAIIDTVGLLVFV